MTLVTWRRGMVASGILLVLVGATLMVGGGLYAGKQQYSADDKGVMTGIWVGTFGTLSVVTGVVIFKLGLFGPYPKAYADQLPAVGPEVDD